MTLECLCGERAREKREREGGVDTLRMERERGYRECREREREREKERE